MERTQTGEGETEKRKDIIGEMHKGMKWNNNAAILFSTNILKLENPNIEIYPWMIHK